MRKWYPFHKHFLVPTTCFLAISLLLASCSGEVIEDYAEKFDEKIFEAVIESFNETTWFVIINQEFREVDITSADINGEPREGLDVVIRGTLSEAKYLDYRETIIATEIEVSKNVNRDTNPFPF